MMMVMMMVMTMIKVMTIKGMMVMMVDPTRGVLTLGHGGRGHGRGLDELLLMMMMMMMSKTLMTLKMMTMMMKTTRMIVAKSHLDLLDLFYDGRGRLS